MPWGFAAAGVASGVAGAAASSAGGKKGSDESRQSQALSNEQAESARMMRSIGFQNYQDTLPLRRQTTNTLQQFAQNGTVPGFLDLNAQVTPTLNAFTPTAHLASLSNPMIHAQQQAMSRDLLRAGVRGGQLTQSLGQGAIQAGLQRSEVSRNLQLNDLQRQEGFKTDDILRQEARHVDRQRLRQTLFGAATDMGTGALTQSQNGLTGAMSGLGASATNFNSLGQGRIMQNMQTQQALGSLAGKGVGYGAGQMLPAYGQGSLGAQKGGAARPIGGATMPLGGGPVALGGGF
jgi:hypothetical protein